MWRRAWRQVRYWWRREERERMLGEEMAFHLEMKAQALVEDGMQEQNAQDTARRQFGNRTLYAEESRGMWMAQWASDLVQDVRHAMRSMARQPGVAIVAMLSSALGIGACALIFGIANYALLRKLPVEKPSQVVSVYGHNPVRGKSGQSMSYPDFEDLREAGSIAGMAAFSSVPATISTNGEPQRYWGAMATANYFDVARPGFVLGRGFDARRDDRPGEPEVVVLGHTVWRARFAGDEGILGKTIELNGRKVTVVGVTKEGFRGTESMLYADFWVPFSFFDTMPGANRSRLQDRGGQWLMTTARLKDGVSMAEASAELDGIGQRLRAAYPGTNKNRGFVVQNAGQLNPALRKMAAVLFLMLLIVAGLVHLTSCANVANLLLARASARGREIATRLAIGAGSGRLVRQLLTESVMLALPGGVAGYGLAELGVAGMALAQLPMSGPIDLRISLDGRVVLFAMALSVLTGVVFGLAPALRATRTNLVGGLKDEVARLGTSRRFGLRNLLVVSQVAICTVLLICSGLFLRSLEAAYRTDVGFTHRNLLMASFDPSLSGYTPEAARRMVDRVVEQVRALPGVESVALTNSVPLNMEGTQNAFEPEAEERGEAGGRMTADIYAVSAGYFSTFGIRVMDGEDFPVGVPGEDIAIVNRTLADKAFPGQNPVGRRMRYQGRVVRITGVVAATKSRRIGEEPHMCLYFPIAREMKGNDSLTGMTLVLRTSGDPAGYAVPLRQAIRGIDPGLAVFQVRTMEEQLSQALALPRITAWMFGLAGGIGLVIAAVGLFGVISFSVSRRTKEIGIRMALGAKRGEVLQMVLGEGFVLTVIGAALGMGLAVALGRMAASLLYGISPTDGVTFAVVPVVLLAIAMGACLGPARRAATLDPIRALRYE